MLNNYIALLESCDALFSQRIKITQNICGKNIIMIRHEPAYIKIMENTSITISGNEYCNSEIGIELDKSNIHPYAYCTFQYVKQQYTSTTLLKDYRITLKNNLMCETKPQEICESSFHQFTTHCRWILSSVFHSCNPGEVNQQIIHSN